MRARAEAAEHTRLRIIGAAIELAAEKPVAAITLPLIAERASVSVQTVLRQFGSREGLIEEAAESGRAAVLAERRADPDDIEGSFDALIDHYEARGDGVLLLLGQESWDQTAAEQPVTETPSQGLGRPHVRAHPRRAFGFTSSGDSRSPRGGDRRLRLEAAATRSRPHAR